MQEELVPAEAVHVPYAKGRLELWVCTTDAGPDVSTCRQLAQQEMAADPRKIMFDGDCLSHQYHIITKSILWSIEEFIMPSFGGEWASCRYYTTLASLLHVWRDNAANIFCAWVAKHTAADAIQQNVHRVAPRPISGRWSRKGECERFILNMDREKCAGIFADVVGTRGYFYVTEPEPEAAQGQADQAQPVAEDRQPQEPEQEGDRGRGRGRGRGGGRGRGRARQRRPNLDDTQDDENVAYSKKMGKWSRKAVRAIKEVRFWIAMRISSQLSAALDILQWTIQKGAADNEAEVGNLARLVFGKSASICSCIERLLHEEAWADVRAFAVQALQEEVCNELWPRLAQGIRKCVLRLLSGYHRRIQNRFEGVQYRLLWFAHRDPREESVERCKLARFLLESDDSSLHITGRKFKAVFRRELRDCASNAGRVSTAMYTAMRYIACHWTADTQEIEGIMNLIKIASDKGSSRISLALVDARVATIKATARHRRRKPRHVPRLGFRLQRTASGRALGMSMHFGVVKL